VNGPDLTPEQKYVGFRRAFDTVSTYEMAGNYIGAYVVSFSILEDRIAALFSMAKDAAGEQRPTSFETFAKKLKYLRKGGILTAGFVERCLNCANERNSKLHAAMWQLDAFRAGDSRGVIDLARAADAECRKAKRRRNATTATAG
jgi:hypothetical protein